MPLDSSILTQTATVRVFNNTTDDYYEDVSSEDPTNYTDWLVTVPCRVTKNLAYHKMSTGEAGYLNSSTHVIFANLTDPEIKMGYILIIDSDWYDVQFVDRTPGGSLNEHQQIYACKKER